MKKNALLVSAIVVGLAAITLLSRTIDARRANNSAQLVDEPLYVSASTAKHLSLAFSGLASDWYWMRSLQYVGGKIVNYEDTHEGRVDFGSLGSLNLQLLPQLLQVSTALDPQFMAPYEYGAMILPELDSAHAVALLDYGIEQNPSAWRLYHHLGYIYWQRKDYLKASAVYAAGAKLPDAPSWMAAMSARLKGEGGSRDSAREMYRHLYETTTDEAIKAMVSKQVIRLNSLDERDAIRVVLNDLKMRTGRCALSWREVIEPLRAGRLNLEATTGAPIDPSGVPYELIKNGCDVGLNINTKVPLK
jgi:tetratricopeptide (TPR) repeat protein